jgi:hypothetical protein
MIGRDEIDGVARDLQVNAADVQRDYVFGWLLANLFGQSRARSSRPEGGAIRSERGTL